QRLVRFWMPIEPQPFKSLVFLPNRMTLNPEPFRPLTNPHAQDSFLLAIIVVRREVFAQVRRSIPHFAFREHAPKVITRHDPSTRNSLKTPEQPIILIL